MSRHARRQKAARAPAQPIEPARVGFLLRAAGRPLRRAMLSDEGGRYKRDSCIAASRIGMDFLAELGIHSEAVRVEAMLISADLANRYRQEGRLPSSQEERERWVAETGGHSVGLGYPMGDGKPGLHVVLLVAGRWLWDLSIDQADRRHLGLRVPGPLAIDLEDAEAFKRGKVWQRSTEDGDFVSYRIAAERSEDWRQSNNWRRDGRDAPDRRELVEALLASLAEALRDHLGKEALE